jgi:hypothetical protein
MGSEAGAGAAALGSGTSVSGFFLLKKLNIGEGDSCARCRRIPAMKKVANILPEQQSASPYAGFKAESGAMDQTAEPLGSADLDRDARMRYIGHGATFRPEPT